MQRKQLLLLFLSFVFLNAANCFAQGPTWSWAQSISQTGRQGLFTAGIGTDASGNIYATGCATGTGANINGTILQSGDMFLVKYDQQANVIWVRKSNPMAFPGSNSMVFPSNILTDAAGNSYITGNFMDTLYIGSFSIPCKGRYDIFTVKYDSVGNVLWVKTGGSPGSPQGFPPMPPYYEDESKALAIDGFGNCYIGGYVMTSPGIPATFDTAMVKHNPLSPGVGYESIIAKYNASGQVEWVRKVPFMPEGLTANSHGCYFTGTFSGSAVFDTLMLTSNGQEDVCFGLINTLGDFMWAKNFGGYGDDLGSDIAVNQYNEVFLTGTFRNTLLAGPDTLISLNKSVFIVKSDSIGSIKQALQTKGTGAVENPKIEVDTAGNRYLSCSASGNIKVGQQSYNALSQKDLFLMKWNNGRQLDWADMVRGANYMQIADIVLNPSGQALFVTGDFQNTLVFGNHAIMSGGSNSTIFLAKLDHIQTTGISSVISEQQYVIYPNPASKSLNVGLPLETNSAEVEIKDLSGRTVLKTQLNTRANVLDIAAVPAGMYLVTIVTKEGSVTKKLSVVK